MTRIIQAYGSPRAKVGDVLSIAVAGRVDGGSPPITYTNQWHVEGRPINGETGETFTVREQDNGKRITCVTTAIDGIGRRLILAPSNEILINPPARGPEGPGQCPPKREYTCPETPPIEKRAKPQPKTKTAKPKPKAKAQPSPDQIKREMRKAGGCRSCGGRRRS